MLNFVKKWFKIDDNEYNIDYLISFEEAWQVFADLTNLYFIDNYNRTWERLELSQREYYSTYLISNRRFNQIIINENGEQEIIKNDVELLNLYGVEQNSLHGNCELIQRSIYDEYRVLYVDGDSILKLENLEGEIKKYKNLRIKYQELSALIKQVKSWHNIV